MKKLYMLLILLFAVLLSLKGVATSGNTNETISIIEAHCYPNPFDNEQEVTHIKFTSKSDVTNNNATISIIIYDFNGNKVWSKKLSSVLVAPEAKIEEVWGGENDIGEKVANGLYFCKVIVEANNTVYKVIKILVK